MDDFETKRIAELRSRSDPDHQAKVARIRRGIADGTFVGRTHTRSDLEGLDEQARAGVQAVIERYERYDGDVPTISAAEARDQLADI